MRTLAKVKGSAIKTIKSFRQKELKAIFAETGCCNTALQSQVINFLGLNDYYR
jgi:hypothetical protein